jgi:ubiquitin C-terminal hydrolase
LQVFWLLENNSSNYANQRGNNGYHYNYGSQRTTDLKQFKWAFSQTYVLYQGYDQKDGYEFMMLLLECLKEELNKLQGTPEYKIIRYFSFESFESYVPFFTKAMTHF